jgi:hypothetical protein
MRPSSGSVSEIASTKPTGSEGSTPVRNELGEPPLDELMNKGVLGADMFRALGNGSTKGCWHDSDTFSFENHTVSSTGASVHGVSMLGRLEGCIDLHGPAAMQGKGCMAASSTMGS